MIIESTVINEYLDDAYPEPRLKPADAAARARMRLWTKQLGRTRACGHQRRLQRMPSDRMLRAAW